MCCILRYLKGAPGKDLVLKPTNNLEIVGFSYASWAGDHLDRRSVSGFCVFIGGNLVSWKSKKQNVVARSSAEVEYRAMAHTACEMLWVKSIVQEMGFSSAKPMKMFCDNQATMYIANNPVFHERTKHIEVDCHFIRDMVMRKQIVTSFVRSSAQLGDILTKALNKGPLCDLCNKLGMIDTYAPA